MTDKELYERFRAWWNTEGVFYDPDTEDVPWFDKRRELAEYAFIAGHKTIDPIDTRTRSDVATPDSRSRGLYNKFKVNRVDGADALGKKHHGCRYFVLDLDHDPFSPAAVTAYAEACKSTHPLLAADLVDQVKGNDMESVSDIEVKILCEGPRPVTVCADCANMRKAYKPHSGSMVPVFHCKVHRVEYLNYSPSQFMECEKLNTHGNCEFFILKQTSDVEEPKRSFWQKIKSLGR